MSTANHSQSTIDALLASPIRVLVVFTDEPDQRGECTLGEYAAQVFDVFGDDGPDCETLDALVRIAGAQRYQRQPGGDLEHLMRIGAGGEGWSDYADAVAAANAGGAQPMSADLRTEVAIRVLAVARASFAAAWPYLCEAWEGHSSDAAREAGHAIEVEFAKLERALKVQK